MDKISKVVYGKCVNWSCDKNGFDENEMRSSTPAYSFPEAIRSVLQIINDRCPEFPNSGLLFLYRKDDARLLA